MYLEMVRWQESKFVCLSQFASYCVSEMSSNKGCKQFQVNKGCIWFCSILNLNIVQYFSKQIGCEHAHKNGVLFELHWLFSGRCTLLVSATLHC